MSPDGDNGDAIARQSSAAGRGTRRGYHRACIAVAAKNARVVWAMLKERACA
jgi:hypothetical protein